MYMLLRVLYYVQKWLKIFSSLYCFYLRLQKYGKKLGMIFQKNR